MLVGELQRLGRAEPDERHRRGVRHHRHLVRAEAVERRQHLRTRRHAAQQPRRLLPVLPIRACRLRQHLADVRRGQRRAETVRAAEVEAAVLHHLPEREVFRVVQQPRATAFHRRDGHYPRLAPRFGGRQLPVHRTGRQDVVSCPGAALQLEPLLAAGRDPAECGRRAAAGA